MANIWRRKPSFRLKSRNLIKKATTDPSKLIADGFWEYTAPPPPTGLRMRLMMGVGE